MKATANRKSGVVIPHQAKWYQRLLAALIVFLIRCLAKTIRFRFDDRSDLIQRSPPMRAVFVTWHNRLALSLIIYNGYIRKFNQDRQLAALVSASRDGGLLAEILEGFGVEPVRGSSSRRGGQALVEMNSLAELGYDVAITPDGPRGPRYRAQEGAIVAGQVTGLPVVPMSYHVNWKICLKSWDGFQIPLPFARCNVIFEKQIAIPREISDEQRGTFRKQLEQSLNEITHD